MLTNSKKKGNKLPSILTHLATHWHRCHYLLYHSKSESKSDPCMTVWKYHQMVFKLTNYIKLTTTQIFLFYRLTALLLVFVYTLYVILFNGW